MLPYPGPARPSLPAGATTSVSSRSAPADGSGRRAVLEGCERLGDPDERDPRRVESDAVQVRVDGALEPGDQLVGAAEDRPAPARLALPARDPDREHRRPGRDAVHLPRAFGADEEAGHLRAVPFEPCRVLRAGPRVRVAGVAHDVVAARDLAEDVRVVRVDARVEQCDRHAAPVEPGRLTSGRLATPGASAPFSISVEETEAGYVTRTG